MQRVFICFDGEICIRILFISDYSSYYFRVLYAFCANIFTIDLFDSDSGRMR